jgi:hypothetical protein
MIYEKILDIFPPPAFLDFPYTGICISDNFVRCVRFVKKNSNLTLETYTEKPIPRGVVSSGIINNIDEMVNIMKALKKELNIKYARVSLPEEKAFLFTTKIPLVSKKEIRSTIEFKIEENVPLPADEIIFDYVVTNPVNYREDLDVVVSAVPTKIVDLYVDFLQKAGIQTLSLETKSQAVARAMLSKSNKGTFIIVHFSAGKAGLYVVSDNIVHFTSSIVLEGEFQDNPNFLSNEIKKLESYWYGFREKTNESINIDQIIICGEISGDSIVSHLSAHHDIPVSLGNVWTNVFDIKNFVPPIPFVDSLKFSSAIGLAIPMEILI